VSVPKRPTQLYDVAILGGELAGVVAGAVLAKRGHRVLHVDDGSDRPDREEGGFLLPNRPDLLPPPRSLPSLHAILDELGMMPQVGRSILPHPRGLQLVLPDARLDLAPQDEERSRELERSFGPRGPGYWSELQGLELPITPWLEVAAHVPPQSLVEAWKLRGPARKLLAVVEGKEISSPLMDAARDLFDLLVPAPEGMVGLARTLSPILPRPSVAPWPRLWRVFRSFIASHRGELVDPPAAPQRVELERGAFGGVQFEGLSVPHRARLGILALAPERVAELLARGARRKAEALGQALAPTARRITWNLVLSSEGLPPGLGTLALIRLGREPVLLSVERTRDATGKEVEGLFTLTATANFPLGVGREAALAEMRASVRQVVPFFERHLRHEGSLEGPPSRYQVAGKRRLGIEGLPLEGPLRRTLWASRLSLPGLGLEGSLLAGLRAAKVAQGWLEKK
jgi:hypothetical protein